MENLGAERTVLDDQLDALAHVERRRLLRSLLEESPREVVPADDTDSWEGFDRQNHLAEMHHRHLPKLEAKGFIEWDRQDQVVTRGPQFGEVQPLLELLDAHQDELPVDLV